MSAAIDGWNVAANRYEITTVTHNPMNREMAAMLANAIPVLKWRHHGIGLLQAYLSERDPEVRAHIWHPDLVRPGIEDSGAIHDHRFTLLSHVVLGTMRHAEFHLAEDPDGEWQKYTVINARQGLIDAPELASGSYAARILDGTINAGWSYRFPRGAFHRSRADGLVVSVVTKLEQEERKAVLLVPKGWAPRHAFDGAWTPDRFALFVAMAAKALAGLP